MADYTYKEDAYASHAKILDLASTLRRGRALDVGCAEGYLAKRLVEQGWFVDGIDLDKKSVKKAERFCTGVFIGDISDEEFVNAIPKTYDLLILGDIIEHVADPERTMQLLLKHLRKDGKLIISVPNIAHLYIRLTLFAGIFDYWEKGILDKTHVRNITKSSLMRFFRYNNIKPVDWRYSAVPLPEISKLFAKGKLLSFLHHLNGISAVVWPRLLAYQFVVLAKPLDAKNTNK